MAEAAAETGPSPGGSIWDIGSSAAPPTSIWKIGEPEEPGFWSMKYAGAPLRAAGWLLQTPPARALGWGLDLLRRSTHAVSAKIGSEMAGLWLPEGAAPAATWGEAWRSVETGEEETGGSGGSGGGSGGSGEGSEDPPPDPDAGDQCNEESPDNPPDDVEIDGEVEAPEADNASADADLCAPDGEATGTSAVEPAPRTTA